MFRFALSVVRNSCNFIFLLTLLLSCESPRQPEFRYLENIRISEISAKNISIDGSAVFYNPNAFPLQLLETDIQVAIDGKWLGKVTVPESTHIEASKEFTLPLALSFPAGKLFKNIGSMFILLSKKTVNLRYQGFIRVKIKGITIKIPIENQQDILIGK